PALSMVSTLSLHDALPICVDRLDVIGVGRLRWVALPIGREKRWLLRHRPSELRERVVHESHVDRIGEVLGGQRMRDPLLLVEPLDRKSTRLNSSHLGISYA